MGMHFPNVAFILLVALLMTVSLRAQTMTAEQQQKALELLRRQMAETHTHPMPPLVVQREASSEQKEHAREMLEKRVSADRARIQEKRQQAAAREAMKPKERPWTLKPAPLPPPRAEPKSGARVEAPRVPEPPAPAIAPPPELPAPTTKEGRLMRLRED